MVRMSDILKKLKERKEEAEGPRRHEAPPESVPPKPSKSGISIRPRPQLPEKDRVKEEKEPEPFKIKLSSAMEQEVKVTSNEDNLKLYRETTALISELMKKNLNTIEYKLVDIKKLTGQVEKIADQLILGNDGLLILAFNTHYVDEDYLSPHLVNVCIYSIEAGLGLGYSKGELIDIGLSALVHDVGMTKYRSLAHESRKLSSKEIEEMKNHTTLGSQILENIIGLNKTLIQIVSQEHERADGSGYPRGLEEEFINEYAKIIGLMDVYEAMTHRRPYRSEEYLPQDAIREILSKKDTFSPKVIKALIERVGIYPVGSFVRLNTKEIAQVIKFNREYPLRPVVNIIYDSNGDKLKEGKVLDLTTQPSIFIAKSISIKKEVKGAEQV